MASSTEITTSTIEKITPITFLHIHGSIDSSTVEALTERAITEANACEGHLILDFGGVTSIDGVAVRMLVRVYRALHPEGGRAVRLAMLDAPDRLLRIHKALGLETMAPALNGTLDEVVEAIEAPQRVSDVSGRLRTTSEGREFSFRRLLTSRQQLQ